MEKRYEILNLSVRKLIDLHGYIGTKAGEILRLGDKEFQSSIIKVSVHGTNAMFYQLETLIHSKDESEAGKIIFRDDIFHEVLLYLDFKRIFDEKNKKRLARYDAICRDLFLHGIELELSDGHYHRFVPFIKSGSMSRASVISFIRNDYYEPLSTHLNFGLFNEEELYVLSKLFAYQGLYLSSGIRVPLEGLDECSVIVIKDTHLEQNTKKYSTSLSKKMFDSYIDMMFYQEDEQVYLDLLDYIDLLAKSKNHPKFQEFINDVDESSYYYSVTLRTIRDSCVERINNAKKNNVDPRTIHRSMIDRMIDGFYHRFLMYLGLDKTHHEDELVFFDGISQDLPINMFDGEGIIDLDLMKEINQKYLEVKEPPYHYSIQFRLPFTKGVLHSVDLQRWFDEYQIDYIEDCFGIKRSINQIKIILTESQFKAKKWLIKAYAKIHQDNDSFDPMNHYFQLFKRYDHALYITNTDSIYESGMTTLNYQVLHTPDLFYHEFKKLLEVGNDAIVELATSSDAQINYFKSSDKKPIDRSSIDYQFQPLQDNVMVEMLRQNPAFINLEIYQNRIDSKLNSMIRDMKIGSIPIRGTVRYLSGDLYDLMYRMTMGTRVPEEMSLKYDFYAPGLTDILDPQKYYSLLRNPHITSKELVSSRPIDKYTIVSTSVVIGQMNDKLITEKGIEDKAVISPRWSKREKYFGHLKGIIMVDSYSNFMAAMQTADTDGDVIRLIFDDTYNEAVKRSVKMNKNQILFFPSYEPKEQRLNLETMYDVVKRTFNSRIGIMSNDAFSKSIHAYNANSDDESFKEKMRKQTELLSLIVSAELDAPKSGIAPYYAKGYKKNVFIEFKNKVEANQKESIPFDLTPNAPNLYYLKSNAESLNEKMKRTRKHSVYKGVILFDFQKDESWRKQLNKNLRNEIENLVMAFKDWDKQLGFITHMTPTKQSKALSTISYIISLQYDDTANMSLIENILDKLIVMSIDDLIDIQDLSIKQRWHLSLESDRDNVLESLMPKMFDANEKELLMNFEQSGHKLLFLILSEVINRINSSNLSDLSSLDTISRYRLIIEQAYNRHQIDGSKEMFYMTNKILTGKFELDELIKDHVTRYLSEEQFDQESLSKYVKIYFKILIGYRNRKAKLNDENLKSISNHFKHMSSYVHHRSGALRRTSSIRKDVYHYCQKELKKMFALHKVDAKDTIQYLYASSKFDPSMKFMLEMFPKKVLEHVVPFEEGDQNNAE